VRIVAGFLERTRQAIVGAILVGLPAFVLT